MRLLFLFVPALVLACQSPQLDTPPADDLRTLTVLYSNDEHGWMEGREQGRGAANLMGLWREREGYTDGGPFLLLSGGDHWTGPAISTWFEGESMVELMNAMRFDASAVGNHEFDFGLDNLASRIEQANFPYLGANIRWHESNTTPVELGILESTMVEVNGISVAIIGLSTIDTPDTTNPVNVVDLRFLDYEPVLRQTVARLADREPDLIFVIAHVCMAELKPLAQAVADLDISLMGGGHCNELIAERVGDTILLESNGHFRSYGRAHFEYDIARKRLLSSSYSAEVNESGESDAKLQALVSKWSRATAAELSEVLGFGAQEYLADDDSLQRAVVDSWLQAGRRADIAINNRLALRAPLPEGEITLADIVGLLPFENTLILVELSGAQIVEVMEQGQRPFVGGMQQEGGRWVLSEGRVPLNPTQTYRVMINSFMYEGGAGYDAIARFDAAGFDTEMHYRQPLLDWLAEQQSSIDSPLSLP